ncbi:putative histidinol-phosphatase [Paenibacillus sp. J31TS4]|uniref:histidinol-phosphatase n=1 Tax=Paenibacillus sp. J31TS4 TaxID=2807195 RepID=UPI001B0280B2|nr:histidinol-phosphatase [Paenibacillus sp. J31TS4]GIP40690.1 putative histidinol-phosphatase [Paenibacillus sp. J31TS4]
MKFDLHTHHDRCGHAEGTIRDYIEAALQAGMQVIGISDHSPYFGREEDHAQPHIAMAKSEFSAYISEVLRLKEEYKDRIEVLLGVESDFFPEHAALYQQMYEPYPFDYIIGSVHLSGGVSIFNKKRWNGLSQVQQIQHKDEYYRLIRESAASGMFQILGHIDAMKGYYPAFSSIPTKAVEETLQAISGTGTAIEINTSGKTKDCGGWYPSDDILERALFHGVPVTFGSDAHKPSRVGDEWEQVQQKLRMIGFKEWVFYRQKQPVAVPL